MRNIIIAILSSALLTIVASQLSGINYDILLSDKVYVRNQLDCVMKKRVEVCDKIGRRISTVLPDAALTGKCPTCNEQEKIYMVKTSQHIKKNYPKEWLEIMEMYKVDPKLRDTFFQTPIQ